MAKPRPGGRSQGDEAEDSAAGMATAKRRGAVLAENLSGFTLEAEVRADEVVRVFPCTVAPEDGYIGFVGKPRQGGRLQGEKAEDAAVYQKGAKDKGHCVFLCEARTPKALERARRLLR